MAQPPAAAAPPAGAPAVQPDPFAGWTWLDVQSVGVEGKGWSDTAAYFDRLPARAQARLRPPVWDLSHDSAGMLVRFQADGPRLGARWTLRRQRLAMPHMPATGVSGLDLYALDTADGRWKWLAVGRPEALPTPAVVLVDGLPPGLRDYLLYLPLYNGVTKVEIGVPAGARCTGQPPRTEKPIVFYGTSILQGGCASRPGMCHTSILGRWLGKPVINLGFSGNAQMEPEVAELMAELDPVVYVLDPVPNMTAAMVSERAEGFVRRLRSAHADVPIVLVEDRTYGDAWLVRSRRERNDTARAALRQVYERLVAAGVTGLTYVGGDALFGDDWEATVDGSHPTDVGFLRQAQVLEPVLRSLV